MFGHEVVVLPVAEIETMKSLPESDVSIKYDDELCHLSESAKKFTDATIITCSLVNTPTWAPRRTSSTLPCVTF